MSIITFNDEAIQPLSGTIHSEDYFQFPEYAALTPEAVYKVLTREVTGGIFRNILSPAACEQISTNFWDSPSLRQRGDGVPAYYVGTYHYKKDMGIYLDEAEKTRDDVRALFADTEDFLANFLEAMRAFLAKRGVELRNARHAGRAAGEYLMRSWSDSGKFALEPHDDGAQLDTQLQRGFEISRTLAYTPVAVNICLQNGDGGALHYWNYEPDNNARRDLGLLGTGYPYPVDLLEPCERTSVSINQGDVYFFNGANIHAVEALATQESYRSTISFLMGFIDAETVIYWT
ncbi:MAG: hypothetical protein MK080_11555 [Opitutales bacterium]|nr:hypothetical protein [Opitutales bacterium]NRA27495.1 hypothetical protein [Opitutales bacterium]